MKAIRWDTKKNEWLQATRGISFELAALKIAGGDILDLVGHPNKTRYPHQRIIPSRQATKRYLGGAEK
ncbi:MAG: hypothetical protein AUJ52_10465 [Elusimicrobia bacterium CG1_02_63_36]|nr:MAG: hypothetical protein AUJ52_10465 [Elusimicrobia bacterium CG1_02_63_36]PIP82211.1 MAG: toxin [Elusimicrobia bacterium CG22_combo_CG10-13_8_21_14_all_63_91]PJA12793.1 MAG: toxin [Elusimicrobia bacterium CG_4_10_14_0_2_um_filter_63_34]PJB23009.1 MAG: toxin [Elusimicrobia bacterium CG_4_9_14_3_um_filter_62_55]